MSASANIKKFLRQSFLARVGFAAAAFLLLVAVLAPLVAPANPFSQNLPGRLESPSVSHWMGTDELGRDILSRVVYGARISPLFLLRRARLRSHRPGHWHHRRILLVDGAIIVNLC
jgi:ABC-type dipeptide/oligopeptide/nickel transport system permease subunit